MKLQKKFIKNYLPGFRKGINGCDDLNIYWIFSAILSIYYFETKNIKYLNTLLKVTDLLSSQPLNKLIEMLPNYGLEVVLICENEFIQNLINSTEKNS